MRRRTGRFGHARGARGLRWIKPCRTLSRHLLFASAPFLNVLRAELPVPVARAVRVAADVDLTSYGLTELEQRIARELAGAKG